MKYIFSILLLLTFFASQAQEDTSKYQKYPTAYGPQYKDIWATRVMRLPDTSNHPQNGVPGAIARNAAGTQLFVWDGSSWNAAGGSGSIRDTAHLAIGYGLLTDLDSVYKPNGASGFVGLDTFVIRDFVKTVVNNDTTIINNQDTLFWRVNGNSGLPDTAWIGTQDKNALIIKAWGKTAITIDTTRDVSITKFIGIPSNNYAKFDSATGNLSYDSLRELIAGNNITITHGAIGDTISSTGGGGSGNVYAGTGLANVNDSTLRLDTAYTDARYLADGLIQPGYVTWSGSGLTFDVTSAIYTINGVRYTSGAGSITLTAADPTNGRYDLIAVDNTGAIVKITGTAASNPTIPQVDPATQVYLTAIYVAAGATTPSDITQTIIYDQNTETWSGTATGVSLNLDNTTSPYHLTKSADVGSWTAGQRVEFTKNSGTALSTDYSVFKAFIKLKSALASTANVRVSFLNGTTVVSNVITLGAAYGFTKSNNSSYQNISIPISAFTFSSTTFTKIRFTLAGAGGGMYLDYVQLQGGITTTTTEVDPLSVHISDSAAMLSPYLRINVAAATYVPLTRTVNGKALSSNITLGLASADFANQGTTTTVLHGNASGNPSFGSIVNADITNATIVASTKLSATGTPSSSTYLRGDNTWAAVSSGGITSIATTSPITGGPITTTGTIGINDAAADGSTKGAASFTAADFNATSGNISLDYTNGQAASGSTKGFLTSTDWTTFNNKQNAIAHPAGYTSHGTGTSIYQDTIIYKDTAKAWVGVNTTTPLSVFQIYPTFPGTVATTSGSATVTGTNTRFLSNFTLGDSILINGIYRVVLSIASNTSLTLHTTFPSTLSAQTYSNPAAARGVYRFDENAVLYRYGNPFIRASDSLKTLYLGSSAGAANTTGSQNLYLGSSAGAANTTGAVNLAIGSNALLSSITSSNNVAIGTAALKNSGGFNTAIGVEALSNAATATAQNVAIGYRAMWNNSQTACVAVGYNAIGAGTGTTSTGNVAIGNNSMGFTTVTGSGNTFGGTNSGFGVSSGANNAGWGYSTQSSLGSGSQNTSIGSNTLRAAGSNSDQTALGYTVLRYNAGDGNTGVGSQSIANASLTTQETAVGYSSGQTVTGVSSIAVTNGGSGYTTATVTVAQSTSNFIAATATATLSGGVVTAITVTSSGSGYYAAPTVTITGNGTGATATATLTTGGGNTSLGYQAGLNSNYGLRNIYIGDLAKGVLNSNDKLYVDNADNGTSSFLYGDMTSGAKWLKVNGGFGGGYVAKTSTYSITNNDYTVDCTSGTFTVTLPTAVGITGHEFIIVNSGSGTITIATTSSQTFKNINSTPTSLTLAAVGAGAITSYTVTSNGAEYIVTGKVKNE
jgi:hypothetical protein